MEDEEIEDLRRQGFTEDQIDDFIEAWEGAEEGDDQGWLDQEDQEDDYHDNRFPVLPENWDASQLFLRLHLHRQIDQGLTVYTGAPADEIRSWLHLMRIPPGERLETADSVQIMVRTACQALNERIADRYRQQSRRSK